MRKPDIEFIDNNHYSMIAAINEEISWLKESSSSRKLSLSIATGYFHPDIFNMVEDSLKTIDSFKLLIGADPLPERKNHPSRLIPGDRYVVTPAKVSESIDEGMDYDRDVTDFTSENVEKLQRMIKFFEEGLQSGKIQVRKYTERFLHGKAYIFMDGESCIVGSSNFTPSGFKNNSELNLGRRENIAYKVNEWFNSIWDKSEQFDIAAYYQEKFNLLNPYMIWLKSLWELYGDELIEESEEKYHGNICLTRFQEDGLERAKKIMEKYNGVIVADSVGLGKTYLAGKLIEETAYNKRQRVLVIAPAALRDNAWKNFMSRTDIRVECKSYQDLVNHNLDAKPNEYSLVVVDEAAALRNDNTEQSKAIRELLKGNPPKKIMMMTATPVNNSLWDLYTLLTYFIKNDASFTDKGILSMKKKFQEAENEDPFSLSPNTLFDILDETTVRRTRKFITKWYPNEKVLIDGREQVITFPRTEVSTINYDFTKDMEETLDNFVEIIDDEEKGLKLARYGWKKYAIDPEMYDLGDVITQITVSGLIRSSMLKRLESSLFSFSKTIEKMLFGFRQFIIGLENGKVLDAELLNQLSDEYSDEQILNLIENMSDAPSSSGLDVHTLISDVKHDIEVLEPIHNKIQNFIRNPDGDPKLLELLSTIKTILNESKLNPYPNDFKKILIFSYYEDTVNWIYDWLSEKVYSDPQIGCYLGRMVSVSGSGSSAGVDKDKAIEGFAPETAIHSNDPSDNKYDIMITTDVLSEGQNLQQCANIINYDLPWNPMRLVQRQGRIDRIGSKHKTIHSRCYIPDKRLDELLNLERRIKEKIAKAAMSIGVEANVIPGGLTSDQVYAEVKEEIGKITEGNAEIFESAGEGVHAGSGEEFRRELQNAIEKGWVDREYLEKMPWGVGSCIAHTERSKPGYYFCARIGKNVFLRFMSIDSSIYSKKLECLNNITCTNRTPIIEGEYPRDVIDAWIPIRNNIYEEWMKGTDSRNILPEVRKKFRRMAEIVEEYIPDGRSAEDAEQYGKMLRASWPKRFEKEFPDIPNKKMPDNNMKKLSEDIIMCCDRLGLETYDPETLPVIDLSDVKLICWMKVI